MTKREHFKLEFQKWQSPITKEVLFLCRRTEPNVFNILQGIEDFSKNEVTGLIAEIQNAQLGAYYQKEFLTDVFYSIEIIPPNIEIDEEVTIPMADVKGLLEEWLIFISQ